jgi:hypothetical protein
MTSNIPDFDDECVTEWLPQQTDEMLGALDETERMKVLGALLSDYNDTFSGENGILTITLMGIKKFENKQREYIRDISRILKAAPYPAALQEKDVALARGFHERWKAEQAKPGPVTTGTETFLRNCWIAATESKIDPAKLDIIVKPIPENRLYETERNQGKVGAVSVAVSFKNGKFVADTELNETLPIWEEPVENAVSALHEVAHIDQAIFHHEQPLGHTPEDLFYEEMAEQGSILKGSVLKMAHSVYRYTLEERQAHFRSNVFLSLADNAPVLTEEEYNREEEDKRLFDRMLATGNATKLLQAIMGNHKGEKAEKASVTRAKKPEPFPG